MQQQGERGAAAATSTRRRLTVPRRTAAASAASVWETRMKMDEVKGGVKVFSAAADDADEEGLRVYSRLRRNQSDAGGGAAAGTGTGAAAAAAKKRRNWKASEPVTAIGDLRKSRSDAAAATGMVTARRAVATVAAPEKKVAAGVAEVKEVVVVEVEKKKPPPQQPENFDEETEEEEEEWEEELEEEEEEKEVLDQDHMAIDDEGTVPATDLHQVDEQDLEPPTKKGVKPVAAALEDERAANPEPVKLAASVNLKAMNPEPITPPPAEKKPTPVIVHRVTNAEPTRPSPEKKSSPVNGRRIPKQEPLNTPEEEYEEIQGRPSGPSRTNGRMQNIVDLVMWKDVSKSAFVFGFGTFLLISCSYAKDLNFNTITAASYLGLVYLGLRFLCKSILNRGESVECDDEKDSGRYHHHLVGEEDAIWLLRLVLPYVNEVLLNLRSLFSGEPATTMKVKQKSSCCFGATVPWTHASLSRFVPTDRVMHVICSWHCCCLQWPGVATLSPSGRWPNWCSLASSSFQRSAPLTPRSSQDMVRETKAPLLSYENLFIFSTKNVIYTQKICKNNLLHQSMIRGPH
ncbi:hypothetical protein BRADI_3g19770v3 [Brachypodium distachyon]|uniref:Reticulon domain-containing protein n=1 Tax=Brachypodium distachyon TaxID=15368 RepID=A0A0Q3F993_BRADI|nr:hypothetical protein BRADI_3g19770v3 [Brachypodium distachyon]